MDAVLGTALGVVDPFRASDGVLLHRRVWEPVGSPRGDLLLGHGIGESLSRYTYAARAFTEGGWRVIAWDLRGHGRSEGALGHVDRWERYHLDLAEQLAALRRPGRKLVVVAHSMGALIALGAAAHREALPDRFVLSAPALDAAVAGWKRALAPYLSRIVPMLRIPTGIGSDLDPGDSMPSEEPAPPPWVLAVTARMGDEAFRAQRDAHALVARGGALGVPTLVIHGTNDRIVRPEWCAPIGALSDVEYYPLEGFNHHPFATRRYREAVAISLRFLNAD
ncbi:MAG: alpha/beta fold hydrolase [Candidatus Limnocylindrus sp.]|jgi:alpha-beta hydrolase superfamily lysophospholipase